MLLKFYFWLIISLNLLSSNDASDPVGSLPKTEGHNTEDHKTEADQLGRTKCPSHCICANSSAALGNESFAESTLFETNCTDIESGLASILADVPSRTTHLYLFRNLFTEQNQFKLPVLDKLRFLKLTLNTIQFIDDDVFSNIPQLHTLKINHNQLNSVPKAISRLKQLRSLVLQNNQIKSIDKSAFSENVNLESIDIKESSIDSLNYNAFGNLTNLRKLTLSSIKHLGTLPNLKNLNKLEHLTVDRCEVRFIPIALCDWLPSVKSLTFKSNLLTSLPHLTNCSELQLVDLSYNFITSLDAQYFFPKNPSKLIYLLLRNNLIQELEESNLAIFSSLQVLDLESNSIANIHPKTFSNLTNLRDLNLGKNKFPTLPTEGLQNIVELKTFGNANLKEFPRPIHFPRVQKLALSYAYHCCNFMRKEDETGKLNTFGSLIDELDFSSKIYEKVTWLHNDLASPHFHPNRTSLEHFDQLNSKSLLSADAMLVRKYEVECIPKPGPFMPCEDLFDFWTLRCSAWIVFLLSVIGNATVIVVMLFGRTKLDVPRFLVCNLALADFLMGIYLAILAIVDSATLTVFRTYAVTWQNSTLCSIAGFLAVFSTESSVFILAVITLERNYAITNAMHLNKRLSLRKASLIMVFGYIFVLTLAILPLLGVSSYQKFAVCLPFEIEDSYGRAYVISLVTVNGFAFLILIFCYLRMYLAIRDSQVWFSYDSRIAKRMSLLVFTDFLCWAPIALCTVSSVFFNVNIINLSQAKIFTIFILPLNSCCNPFLYAIFTKQFKKDALLLCKKLEEAHVNRAIGGCKHSSNYSNRHTPDGTNSIEKHYSDCYLYCAGKQLPAHLNHYEPEHCTAAHKRQLASSANHPKIAGKLASKECSPKCKAKVDEPDDVFHDDRDEESLLRFEVTNYFLKNNYDLIMDRAEDGSKLVCKCGITTMLPKSKLFFEANALKEQVIYEEKTTRNSTKATAGESKGQQPRPENELNEDVFDKKASDDKKDDEPVVQRSRSMLGRLLDSLLGDADKVKGRKEKTADKERKIRDEANVCDKCDCQLNANEIAMKRDGELNADLFFRQHAERLHQQLIKSKQRLDSISSENYSSRSDSIWRQQASQQLRLIEKYFHEKIRQPGLIRYDRKSSTTGSLSTSTFRISRSSVSSDNFRPIDHRLLSGEKRGLTDDDLRRHLLEAKQEAKVDDAVARTPINPEVLNNLFKQFLCSDCASKKARLVKKVDERTKEFRVDERVKEFRADDRMKEFRADERMKEFRKEPNGSRDLKGNREFKDGREFGNREAARHFFRESELFRESRDSSKDLGRDLNRDFSKDLSKDLNREKEQRGFAESWKAAWRPKECKGEKSIAAFEQLERADGDTKADRTNEENSPTSKKQSVKKV